MSQDGWSWKGPLKTIWSNSPAVVRDTYGLIRCSEPGPVWPWSSCTEGFPSLQKRQKSFILPNIWGRLHLCILHVSVPDSLLYKIVSAHLGHLTVGNFMTSMVRCTTHHLVFIPTYVYILHWNVAEINWTQDKNYLDRKQNKNQVSM